MVKLPKRVENKGQIKAYVANLFEVLSKLAPAQLKLLYGDLFTEYEATMLAKRLEIARGLLQGKSYLQIQQQLGVTANTVAQIQKVLKHAGSGFRLANNFLASVKSSAVKPPAQSLAERAESAEALVPKKKKFFNSVFGKVFHST